MSWPDNRSTYDKGRVTIRSSYALAVLGNLLRGGKLLAQLRAHDIDLLRQAYNTDVVELLGTAPGGEIWHRELTRWGWIPVRGPDAPVEQGGRRMTDFAAAVDSTYSLCEAR
ncbi:MAG: hypothetical protein GWN73_07055, partial [Actinobacteria bacterium]|nr:hypothetical protein [Actinomycetota bacterium]